ncbi:MAG: YjbH domain-containing protein [Calditrichaeota bacterium]|nr:YjbH domain-containing protein [Candidatus Cloacimonadota bacterium]MCA9784996.1 YjbH domain-containing protein [Candidatus Cloacimonadota bacterium]MCB1046236.1 YjbH domain-containing protein [Calditrichota bacterium]MCB9474217.1 YjbH domain-containing protein [Candidatus Delongbacteria bacterium]
MIHRFLFSACLALACSGSLLAQDMKELPINRLIDNPTAGILEKGTFDFSMTLYKQGGVLVGFNVGLLDRLNMGASFGGTKIISDSTPDWNQRPELALKYRLVDETHAWPAIALGYDGQGHGVWISEDAETGYNTDLQGASKSRERYQIKAKGFYGTAGKNYVVSGFGKMGVHVGANVNPIEDKDDRGLNFWLGLDKEINDELSAVAEYDFALDDVHTGLSRSKGFMNLGARWTFAERLSLEVDFKDIFKNHKGVYAGEDNSINREIKITYMESF